MKNVAKRLTRVLGKILSEVWKDRDDVVDQFLSGLRKMGIESSVPHIHKEIGNVVGNGFPRDPTDYGFPMGLIRITNGPIRWISIRRYIVGQKWGERGDSEYMVDYVVPDARIAQHPLQLSLKTPPALVGRLFTEYLASEPYLLHWYVAKT